VALARILVTFREQVLREVPLADKPLRIGRNPSCDIHLDNLGVSRDHAAILPHRQMGYIVEDLDSRNGTLLNGSPLRKRAVLVGGDCIGIGRHVLVFRTDAPEPAKEKKTPPSIERTIALDPAPGRKGR
jgi:pSer/pThr/pTyr-binding forkhead associated (FHA) protein